MTAKSDDPMSTAASTTEVADITDTASAPLFFLASRVLRFWRIVYQLYSGRGAGRMKYQIMPPKYQWYQARRGSDPWWLL
ncbi:hypothetical protein E4U45_000668 [Claviceps purpurea]|nr:hypothetical protein E4U45_000668 [Claviceps purpurea]